MSDVIDPIELAITALGMRAGRDMSVTLLRYRTDRDSKRQSIAYAKHCQDTAWRHIDARQQNASLSTGEIDRILRQWAIREQTRRVAPASEQ